MRYSRPDTLESALIELSTGGGVLAGGTDLVTLRRHGRWAASCMVDVKSIAGLARFHDDGATWFIGGACSMATVLREAATIAELGALVDGAGVVGGPQTRRRATVGGNVWRASPSADSVPGLLVANADVRLLSSTGARDVVLSDFLTGPGTHLGRPDELLEAIIVPRTTAGSAYQRATQRASLDLATVGVAVSVTRDGGQCVAARIAVGGAAPTAVVVEEAAEQLLGTDLSDTALGRAADATAAALAPIDDVRGSADYRRHAARVLVARVARTAWSRASERSGT